MNIHDEIKNLLAAYEQDVLPPDEESRIEEHLYECDDCFSEAASFSGAAALLRRSAAVREEIARLAESPGSVKRENTGPSSSANFLKYLLAAAVLCVLVIPFYWYGSDGNVRQTLNLLASRAAGQETIDLATRGDVRINFQAQNALPDTLHLLIANISGDTLVFEPEFRGFNEFGLGTVVLPVGMFEEGHYYLILTDPGDSLGRHQVQYLFRAK